MLSADARASIRIAVILVLALVGAGPASAQLVPLEVWDWTAWENLGGPVFGVPACASSAPNRLDCFARGTDGLLYRRWWDGASWHGWDAAPGLIIQMAYRRLGLAELELALPHGLLQAPRHSPEAVVGLRKPGAEPCFRSARRAVGLGGPIGTS